MLELSLHILDVMENSIRAGASCVWLRIADREEADELRVEIEDDGPGLAVTAEQALDPFYTTKKGKRTGLGLSLLQATSEQAGGGLSLSRSEHGGLKVDARMQSGHVDRIPLGDLGATLSALACTNPGLDICCELEHGGRSARVQVSEVRAQLGEDSDDCVRVAWLVAEQIRGALESVGMVGERWWGRKERGERERAVPDGAGAAGRDDKAAYNQPAPESRAGGRTEMEDRMSEKGCCACAPEPSEEELLSRLDEVIAEYKAKPGALIPVLQIAQGIFGYLPESALKRIALGLGKPYSEVAGVVGFYSFFSTVPRGKHLIRVCLGTACYVRGGKAVLDALKAKLDLEVGGTTPDRQFSLEVARCFGACGLAPAIMIDDTVYHRVKPTKVMQVLEEHTRKGDAEKKEEGQWHSESQTPAH